MIKKKEQEILFQEVAKNKIVFGQHDETRKVFSLFMEKVDVPENIVLNLIDISLNFEAYFAKAEVMSKDFKNKIIVVGTSDIGLLAKQMPYEKLRGVLCNKNNVIYAVIPLLLKDFQSAANSLVYFDVKK